MIRRKLVIVDGHAMTKKKETSLKVLQALNSVREKVTYHECLPNVPASHYVQLMQPVLDDEGDVIIASSWRADYVRELMGLHTVIPLPLRRMLDRLAMGCSAHTALCDTDYSQVPENPTIEVDEAFKAISNAWFEIHVDLPVRRISSAMSEMVWDVELLMEDLFMNREGTMNFGPGIGQWNPGEVVLLVGDRHGPSLQPYQIRANVAFVDMAKAGSSYWLTSKLIEAKIPESRLYWINAYGPDGVPTDHRFIEKLRPITVLTLGDSASRWCALSSVRHEPFKHPQYHKRFMHSHPYPLIQRLQELFSE